MPRRVSSKTSTMPFENVRLPMKVESALSALVKIFSARLSLVHPLIQVDPMSTRQSAHQSRREHSSASRRDSFWHLEWKDVVEGVKVLNRYFCRDTVQLACCWYSSIAQSQR